MSYEKQYSDAIHMGCDNAICMVEGSKVDQPSFFNEVIKMTKRVQSSKGRIFFVGNGASAAFCNHMALDWSKNGKVLAMSLSDSAMLTALSNDYSYEDAFVEFLKINECGSADLIATISSSGNSPNVVNVLKYSADNGVRSIAFSGLKPDNKSTQLASHSLYVPVKTYGMAECIHQVFLHLWIDKFMEIYEWDRDEVQNMNIQDFKL